MVKLEEHKHATEHKPIERLNAPAKVYIPLLQHVGKICTPDVSAGNTVRIGERIASSDAKVFAPIHASISGVVSAIDDVVHPSAGRCKAVIVENDGLEAAVPFTARSIQEIHGLSVAQLRQIVLEAGIVGMGGASFPTHIKLTPPKHLETLIVNGAECESYLTSDARIMVERADEIVKGIDIASRCAGIKKVIIAIENNKPEAIEVFQKAAASKGYAVSILKSFYPQGGEKQLIRNVLGIEVPSGKLPFDVGVLVQNVATLYAAYEAVYLGKPLYERVVTVSGDCIKEPKNLLVRIGTPIKDLIAACGGLSQDPYKVIFGGPMMGLAQFSLDVPVIKSTNGILVLSKDACGEFAEGICFRCGTCVEECPAGVSPCLITLAAQKEKWPLAKIYGCLDCIECGICSYVCPQRVNNVQAIRLAKQKVPR